MRLDPSAQPRLQRTVRALKRPTRQVRPLRMDARGENARLAPRDRHQHGHQFGDFCAGAHVLRPGRERAHVARQNAQITPPRFVAGKQQNLMARGGIKQDALHLR